MLCALTQHPRHRHWERAGRWGDGKWEKFDVANIQKLEKLAVKEGGTNLRQWFTFKYSNTGETHWNSTLVYLDIKSLDYSSYQSNRLLLLYKFITNIRWRYSLSIGLFDSEEGVKSLNSLIRSDFKAKSVEYHTNTLKQSKIRKKKTILNHWTSFNYLPPFLVYFTLQLIFMKHFAVVFPVSSKVIFKLLKTLTGHFVHTEPFTDEPGWTFYCHWFYHLPLSRALLSFFKFGGVEVNLWLLWGCWGETNFLYAIFFSKRLGAKVP